MWLPCNANCKRSRSICASSCSRAEIIVFTSNIFAILGLRSLFFLLAGLVDKLRYLKVGLAAVLVFVGIKMTLVEPYKIPPLVSLVVILSIWATSVVASVLVKSSIPRPVELESLPGLR